MTIQNPKTYKEAIDQGYTLGDSSLSRGYVSRKVNVNNMPIQVAGGNRNGQLFVNLPNWESSQYCVRQYLVKPSK